MDNRRRRRSTGRALELVAVFLLVPALVWLLRLAELRPPVVPALLTCTVIATFLFARRYPDIFARALRPWYSQLELGRIVSLFVANAILLGGFVWFAEREWFLDLPLNRPGIWVVLVASYPVLSVVPQEFLFRVWFFRRYRRLFPSPFWRIASSALFFGFAHIVYGNVITVGLATVGGVLFAWTYHRTRSLWAVALEHAAYGLFLFTIGLGRHFDSAGL